MEEATGSGTVLSELELAIQTIVKYYNKYSLMCQKEGIKKKKFREMLQSELNHMLTNTKNKEAVKIMFQELDQDGDRRLNFNEYWDLIGNIVKPFARDKQ